LLVEIVAEAPVVQFQRVAEVNFDECVVIFKLDVLLKVESRFGELVLERGPNLAGLQFDPS
jgi:hypothetical protein